MHAKIAANCTDFPSVSALIFVAEIFMIPPSLGQGRRSNLIDPQSSMLQHESGKGTMPYVPYWFESFANWFPWIVPFLSVLSLWIARLCDDTRVRSIAERVYFGMMIVVATGTLRTMLADEPCWLLHTGSLGMMVLGAVFPQNPLESDLSTIES